MLNDKFKIFIFIDSINSMNSISSSNQSNCSTILLRYALCAMLHCKEIYELN
jgi:hypothetical protein